MRKKLDDNIFKRHHSIPKPSPFENLPILIQDNPSRDFFFPISAEEAVEALEKLPKEHVDGITHIWLRKMKKMTMKLESYLLLSLYVVAVLGWLFFIPGLKTKSFVLEIRSHQRESCEATQNGV